MHLSDNLRSVLLALIGVLLTASLVGAGLAEWRRQNGKSDVFQNLNARIHAWWVMVIVMAATVAAGRTSVLVVFALISMMALREVLTMLPTGREDYFASILAFVLVPVHYALEWMGWTTAFLSFLPLCACLALPAAQSIRGDVRDFQARASGLGWGVLVSAYCLSYVPAVLMLSIPGTDPMELMVFLLVVVESCDVLQYIWGKLMGKRPVAQSVSPSKTVEGLVGGVLSVALVGSCLHELTPFGPWGAACVSVVISLTGFAGGLAMSAMKRGCGVKNWGNMIPGHGGVLDRVDSLCFAGPVFFALLRWSAAWSEVGG